MGKWDSLSKFSEQVSWQTWDTSMVSWTQHKLPVGAASPWCSSQALGVPSEVHSPGVFSSCAVPGGCSAAVGLPGLQVNKYMAVDGCGGHNSKLTTEETDGKGTAPILNVVFYLSLCLQLRGTCRPCCRHSCLRLLWNNHILCWKRWFFFNST